ncbi:hypothetical protein LCGC14_0800830 [marine sediment metagenome]|uniref:Uncharacterized protein n=1 Tax=marine sediment metagenome TaxID=412755 RepID=A0A0F9Q9J0_9ZZZZ
MGILEYEVHNYKKAIAHYKRVLETVDPVYSHKNLFNDLAESCYLDKQYGESLKWAKEQLKHIPDQYESLFFSGVGYYKQGKYDVAAKFLEQALNINEVDKGLYSLNDLRIRKRLYKIYLKAGEHKKMLKVIKEILAEEPDNKKSKDLYR